MGGECAWWGGGMHGGGACVAGDVRGGGHAWQGVCMAGGMHGGGGRACMADTTRYSQ